MDKKYWIALIKSGEDYYVLSSEKGEVNVRNTKKEMLDEFESKYSKHSKTSSLINYLIFQPSIVEFSLYEIGQKLFDLKKGIKVKSVLSPAGSFYGLLCNKEKKSLEKIFENGAKIAP